MKKILIIDDEVPVRKMLKKLFERNGYDISEATNGNQGIKLFNEQHPDLIISDLIMPEKEGLETIRELKKSKPYVPIIAIPGGGLTDPKLYLNLALRFGAVHLFAKPIDNDILLSTIKEILSGKTVFIKIIIDSKKASALSIYKHPHPFILDDNWKIK